jgi:eukaryotic-like serine/threonine-protein kinase
MGGLSSGDAPRVRPLQPGDPVRMGEYRIVGRLGEGGMGSVFLAQTADEHSVALKVIRAELADNPDFRRRFRDEVARARQVPPFCTAEVLDADTDHDPPYLVVEYVDGPNLGLVVRERGPLSPANQHGLAVGVAVALTAIHGAGVIHRDLKPSNVLLAPGSPKVIDFGIAKSVEGMAEAQTGTNQVMGTVAYMAPERFGPGGGGHITAAADVFAWGAVVTYAGTGRTPFEADIPAAMAVRIMTQPPDLEGLRGSLRELVEQALAKDPACRPTARELVDRLLATGSSAAARPSAFANQPEVLAEAGILAAGPTTVPAAGPTVVPAAGPTAVPAAASPVVPGPAGSSALPARTDPRPPAPTQALRTEVVTVPRQRRLVGVGVALAVLVALVAGASAAGLIRWNLPLAGAARQPPSPTGVASTSVSPQLTASVTATPAPVTSVPAGSLVLLTDSLQTEQTWRSRDDSAHHASCVVDAGLHVTLTDASTGSYRCPGDQNALTDFAVSVDVTLENQSSCAGVWFRFSAAGGYLLKVCPTQLKVIRISGTGESTDRVFPAITAIGSPVRVSIRGDGTTFYFFRADDPPRQYTNAQFDKGKVVLGVAIPDGTTAAPFMVSFANITIWTPPGA